MPCKCNKSIRILIEVELVDIKSGLALGFQTWLFFISFLWHQGDFFFEMGSDSPQKKSKWFRNVLCTQLGLITHKLTSQSSNVRLGSPWILTFHDVVDFGCVSLIYFVSFCRCVNDFIYRTQNGMNLTVCCNLFFLLEASVEFCNLAWYVAELCQDNCLRLWNTKLFKNIQNWLNILQRNHWWQMKKYGAL